MAKTMYWQLVPGVAHIVVHTQENPTDEEWVEYLNDIAPHAGKIKGMFVYSPDAGPSASQRNIATEHWKKVGVTPQIAVMTQSRMIAGVVTALSWVLGAKIRAFGPSDFEGAVKSLNLTTEERELVRNALIGLARQANTELAFLK